MRESRSAPATGQRHREPNAAASETPGEQRRDADPAASRPAVTPTEEAASLPPGLTDRLQRPWGQLAVLSLALAWAATFGWLAIQRHLAGGSHAEDLGFTDQVLANFLRGQFFRMSIYQGATWNTEIDIGQLARPDSLLAFHFEPMLLLLVPLYAIGGGAVLLLILQAVALAAGAVPAYRLGQHASGSAGGGVAVALAYLLSPLGQWAVLADFHTATLAAPLLVLAVERVVVKKSAVQALAVAALAATAREDVGLALVALGLALLVPLHSRARTSPPLAAARLPSDELSVTTKRHVDRHANAKKRHAGVIATSQNQNRAGLAFLCLGIGSTILATLVIRNYSGGASPFDVRYGATLGAGLGPAVAALGRPAVLDYLGTLALTGGWLGVLSPLALLPALPALALNVLSTSPWMAAGKAHYSSLILPFITVGAAAGLHRLRGRTGRTSRTARVHLASGALVLTSLLGYVREGAGPLGGNYAPALVTEHALRAETLAKNLPPNASISASSALVPRLSRRASVYVFPAVLDAEYIFLDLRASPAPTSAGDVFLRVRALLADGGWNVQSADDGLLLLQRTADAAATDIGDLSLFPEIPQGIPQGQRDSRVTLLSATLLASPDGAVDVDGPRGLLHTIWRADHSLPSGTHLDFWLDLRDGRRAHAWDIAPLWWDPPERWTPGEPVVIDVPDVPLRQFRSWQATWTTR